MLRAGTTGNFLPGDRADVSRSLHRSMGWRDADGRRRAVAAGAAERGWRSRPEAGGSADSPAPVRNQRCVALPDVAPFREAVPSAF
jgi:hypothetical protein